MPIDAVRDKRVLDEIDAEKDHGHGPPCVSWIGIEQHHPRSGLASAHEEKYRAAGGSALGYNFIRKPKYGISLT